MRSLSSGSANAAVYPSATRLHYYGYTAHNPYNAAASFTIEHGLVVLETVTLAAHESRNNWPQKGGIACPNGLTVNRTSGSCEVAVYFRNP